MFLPLIQEKYKNTDLEFNTAVWPQVSIIIVVKNELENLKVLIPNLLNQTYPSHYNIHILDDHSTDGSLDWLKKTYNNISILNIHQSLSEETVKGKKQQLLQLHHIPTFELLAFTDADCRPGKEWLHSMVRSLGNHDIVLGYSPYFLNNSWINKLVQYETLITAFLYFGLAKKNIAYMGVGRNVVYRRDVYLKNNSLQKFSKILSGDDDLTINELQKQSSIVCNLEDHSFVYSLPKNSFQSWLQQKKRHVSTARYYGWTDQILLFGFYGSFVLWWCILVSFLFIKPIWAIFLILSKVIWVYISKRISTKVFDLNWKWSHWFFGEITYVLALFYLLPSATIKKVTKW